MFRIRREDLENKTKPLQSKIAPGNADKELYSSFKKITWNIIDLVSNFSVYEMAHWVNNIDRWIHNRSCKENTRTYKRGTILFVDLGASNFRFEPSFTHPCIVLQNRRNSIYVVPCSTKKYGKGYPEIIDATKADGFQANTGIQVESTRWIHKNRVVSAHNKVENRVLDEIDKYLLNNIPSYKKEKTKFLKEEEQNKILTSRVADLEAEIDSLKLKLEAAAESQDS